MMGDDVRSRTMSEELKPKSSSRSDSPDRSISNSLRDGINSIGNAGVKLLDAIPGIRNSMNIVKGACAICGAIGLKEKRACSVCENTVCSIHCISSEKDPAEKVCERCVKKSLKEEIKKQEEENFRIMYDKIHDEKRKTEDLKHESNQHDNDIAKIRSKIRDVHKQAPDKMKEIERKIAQQRQSNESQQNLIDKLVQTLQEAKNSETLAKSKYAETLTEVDMLRAEYVQINIQKNEAANNLDKLNTELKTRIPFRQLRNLTCADCYREIKKVFKEQLRIGGVDNLMSTISFASTVRPQTIPEDNKCNCRLL